MRRSLEVGVIFFSWSSALLLLAGVVGLIAYLLHRGGASLSLDLIFGDVAPWDALLMKQQVFDGLFPAMAGTFFLIIGSMSLAIPVGVAGGIYMAEYCGGKIKSLFNLTFDILAGIPSVVVGLAGLVLTIMLNRTFQGKIAPCLLISCCSLALLVLPYLIRTTQTALESVDPLVRKTAPALGASRVQNISLVLLPNALADIFSGIILATSRCIEDTAVIMLTGAVATAGIPRSIFGQYEALPFYIYYISSQYTSPDELANGFGAAIILLILCTGLLLSALWIQKRVTSLLLYR